MLLFVGLYWCCMADFHKYRNLNKEKNWSFLSNWVKLQPKLTKFKMSMESLQWHVVRKILRRKWFSRRWWEKLFDRCVTHFSLLSTIVTGDQSCVYGYDPETKVQSSQWKTPSTRKQRRFWQKKTLNVFPTVAGTVEQVYLCGKRILWKRPLINYIHICNIINI